MAGLFMAMISTATLAQSGPGIISVSGSGVHRVTPDTLVIRFNIAGTAPNSARALEEFRRNRQRIEDVLNPMDFPETKLEFEGKTFNGNAADSFQFQMQQRMMFRNEGDDAIVEQHTVSEDFRVQLVLGDEGVTDEVLNRVARIIDMAVELKATEIVKADLYGTSGNPGRFVVATVTDLAGAKKEAMRKAFEDARSQAEELAKLAGVSVGPVHSLKLDENHELEDFPAVYRSSAAGVGPVPGEQIEVGATVRAEFLIK